MTSTLIRRTALLRAVNSTTSSSSICVCTKIPPATITLGIHPPSVVPSFKKWFSTDDGTHDDFAPKRKAVPEGDEALKLIQEHVSSNRIMLYMKGNPSTPMCGFSARVVQALKKEGVDFSSVNVLDYPSIREGVKKFSDWPTIPQLYVDGEFIGGCDIILGMHESGELTELLKGEEEEEGGDKKE